MPERDQENLSLQVVLPPEQFRRIAARTMNGTVNFSSRALQRQAPDRSTYDIILDVFDGRDFYFTEALFEDVCARLPQEQRDPLIELFSQRYPDRAGEFAALARETKDPQPTDLQLATQGIVDTVLLRYPTDDRPSKAYVVTDLPPASITEAQQILREQQDFASTVEEVEDTNGIVETLLTVKPIGERAHSEREQLINTYVSQAVEAARKGSFINLFSPPPAILAEVRARLKEQHGLDTTVEEIKERQYGATRVTAYNAEARREKTISDWVSGALKVREGSYVIRDTPDPDLLREAINRLEQQGLQVTVQRVRERSIYTRMTLSSPSPTITTRAESERKSQERQSTPARTIPVIENLASDVPTNLIKIQRLMDGGDLEAFVFSYYNDSARVERVLQAIINNASLFPFPDYGRYAEILLSRLANIPIGVRVREYFARELPELGRPQY